MVEGGVAVKEKVHINTGLTVDTSGGAQGRLDPRHERVLYPRVLLLWAVCLSSAFALLVTKLFAWRRRLTANISRSSSTTHRS